MKAGSPICEHCKKPFQPKRPWQRFCCKKCHDAWWAKVRKEAIEQFLEKEGQRVIEDKEVIRLWGMAETS